LATVAGFLHGFQDAVVVVEAIGADGAAVTRSTHSQMKIMSITDNLKIAGQYCLPKHALSRLVGKLAAAEAGNLTTKVIETDTENESHPANQQSTDQ
jgi:hypothetical protein